MARQGTSEVETWLTQSNKVTVMAAPAARTQPSPSPTAVVTTNHSDGDDTGGDPHQHRLFFSWQQSSLSSSNLRSSPLFCSASVVTLAGTIAIEASAMITRHGSDTTFSLYHARLSVLRGASPSDFNASDSNDTFRRHPLLWLP
ncbi:hypothetical protein AHAS_Ahas11G0174600 [Arachis hypogaea]